ncbi:16S rRNA (uracil(1498)-N(3))-methyltransferase [Jonesiaceae bacterium BS-20]|uniref:Ribosomal RNA small subunit methyltransferase E n=1 Tax=Jonesiaceae bacterium BS-20 TaxID=3120821 RepID=A0AAU7DR50_9MICO
MSSPVFLAESHDLDAYQVGDTYVLDGTEGRHAGVVQRRGPGELIDIVDGGGARLVCKISTVNQSHLELEVLEKIQEESDGIELVLVQALAKGDRDELAIEAATEVGVDAVVPWQADRSIVIWRGPRAVKSWVRWQATVRAATKQARRAALPEVGQPVDSKHLIKMIGEVISQGGVALVLHEEATTPIRDCHLPELGPSDAARKVLFIVGPEGGMSDFEVTAFQEAGAQLARLGPHVLRTSTAGPIGIALISEKLGRWT